MLRCIYFLGLQSSLVRERCTALKGRYVRIVLSAPHFHASIIAAKADPTLSYRESFLHLHHITTLFLSRVLQYTVRLGKLWSLLRWLDPVS
jgi:hypothetical protein